jgi:hypothetical protein
MKGIVNKKDLIKTIGSLGAVFVSREHGMVTYRNPFTRIATSFLDNDELTDTYANGIIEDFADRTPYRDYSVHHYKCKFCGRSDILKSELAYFDDSVLSKNKAHCPYCLRGVEEIVDDNRSYS